MMARINEVRADLEGYDPEAPAPQCGQDGQREGGFPGPALRSCYDNSFNRTPPGPSTTGLDTEFLKWFECLQEA